MEWHNDTYGCPPDTIRKFYGVTEPNGTLNTYEPYVEVIRSESGVHLTDGTRSNHWCYSYHDSGHGWIELPQEVSTLEEAQAMALILWRMKGEL